MDDDEDTELQKIFDKSKELKTAYMEGETKPQQIPLKKSPNDLRNYRELKLANSMKVLLI